MFQTKIEIAKSRFNISYEDRIMTLGSCFANNIGQRMQNVFFETDVNPFGVLYNPVSIQNSIELLINGKPFTLNDIFENRGLWQSFSHGSFFSDTSSEGCLERINCRFEKASIELKSTNYLLITFGTAWVFESKQSGNVVSNCHKLPSNMFARRRLTVEEIIENYTKLFSNLFEKFPQLKVVFSVSPIRHWKDGAHENNISKSTLLLSIEALQNQFSNVEYFPAYEIQMDELRDYRFYASDMLHPSELAIDYIWERFSDTYFNANTLGLKQEIEQLVCDLNHRPLHPASEEFEKFKQNVIKKKLNLIKRYPFLDSKISS